MYVITQNKTITHIHIAIYKYIYDTIETGSNEGMNNKPKQFNIIPWLGI